MAHPDRPYMLRTPEKISYESLKQTITNIQNQKIKAIACAAYASGARVSELIRITNEDIWVESINNVEYLHIKSIILKKHKYKKGQLLKGIRPDDYRISVARMDEKWLVLPIMVWATKHKGILFPYHRATIYRWLMKTTGYNPHGFRKLRATHLAKIYKFTDQQLVKFFGWADSRPASIYSRLNKEDVAY